MNASTPPPAPRPPRSYARMLAHRTEYVSRADYADRAAMFRRYLERLRRERQGQGGAAVGAGLAAAAAGAGAGPAAAAGVDATTAAAAGSAEDWAACHGVAVIPEGAAGPGALLGLIRQVAWLAGSPQSPLAGGAGGDRSSSGSGQHAISSSSGGSSSSSGRWHLIVDSGTGATATGERREGAAWRVPLPVACTLFPFPPNARQRHRHLSTEAALLRPPQHTRLQAWPWALRCWACRGESQVPCWQALSSTISSSSGSLWRRFGTSTAACWQPQREQKQAQQGGARPWRKLRCWRGWRPGCAGRPAPRPASLGACSLGRWSGAPRWRSGTASCSIPFGTWRPGRRRASWRRRRRARVVGSVSPCCTPAATWGCAAWRSAGQTSSEGCCIFVPFRALCEWLCMLALVADVPQLAHAHWEVNSKEWHG